MDNNILNETSKKCESIQGRLRTNQVLSEEDLAILFLSTIFEEEKHEQE